MGQIFNISAQENFLQEVAKIANSAGSPIVLLPSKRAVPHLQKLYKGRVEALGELNWGGIQGAITDTKRIFELAKIICQKRPEFDLARASKMARGVARLLDEMQTKSISYQKLENIVPVEFAEHWQITFQFLHDVLGEWQVFLAAQNLIEPAERRNLVLRKVAQNIGNKPYLIAGSTGTIPATAELISAIYNSPNGIVVLHGADDIGVEVLPENHSQYNIAQLLKSLHSSLMPENRSDRAKLITTALYPPEKFADVTDFNFNSSGLKLGEFKTEDEEAAAISDILNEVLERPQKTAMLVTNNRNLARKVAAKMQVFGYKINDSTGQSFLKIPAANFLLLLAEAAEDPSSNIKMLAALKHQLVKPEVQGAAIKYELELRHCKKNRPYSHCNNSR